jgi:DNA-binding IclR family transcriptional regulator
MLQYHGFIEQDPETKVYYAGPVLTEIGLAAFREIDIRGTLRPLLEALADEFQETVQLVTLRGTEVQFLDCVESTRVLRTSSRVGVKLPAHCTAAGKVLLAGLSPEQLRELYPDSSLEQRTPRSLATREALEAELADVRKHSYAVQFGESEEDVAAVAALVRGSGRPRSAMAITAPASRLSKRQAAQAGKRLVAAVDRATFEPAAESASA